MSLDGKRVAVLIEDEFNLDEFIYPYHRFREAGADVKVVGTSRAKTFTSHGKEVAADLAAADASVADFDAVIIPGGYAPDKMRRDTDMVGFRSRHGPGRQARGGHLPRWLDAGIRQDRPGAAGHVLLLGPRRPRGGRGPVVG